MRRPTGRSLVAVVVLIGVGTGIALRLWILTSSLGALDGDEAVWGVMARHVLHGEFSVFFWGQTYGGTEEALMTAPLLALFGSSLWTLRAVPVVLWAVAAVLVWRIGRRTLGEPRARLAAVLFWLWPAYFVWKSTRAHGFYESTLVLGLAVVLLAVRLRERESRADLVVLGLALGLGWWASPQVAILALPALVWLGWRHPAVARDGWLAVPPAVVGALPWLVANVRRPGSSFAFTADGNGPIGRLHNLAVSTLPTALGLRVPFSLAWIGGVWLGDTLYVLAIAGFGWAILQQRRRLGPLVLVALAFPLFYAASPYSGLNIEPRYLVALSPVLSLLAASAMTSALRTAAVLAIAVALSVAGVAQMERADLAAPRAEGVAVPADMSPLLRKLRDHHVHHAFATYWVAWRIAFESDERIIAAATPALRLAQRGGRVVPVDRKEGRYPRFYSLALSDPDTAYVFIARGDVEPRASPLLVAVGYRSLHAGGFDVWLAPARQAGAAGRIST